MLIGIVLKQFINISLQHWGLSPLRLAPVELDLQKNLLHHFAKMHHYSADSFSPRSRELPQILKMTREGNISRPRGRHLRDQ